MSNIVIKNNELVYSFSKLNDYEDFEKIESFLKERLSIKIIKKLDGPDMRIWDLEIMDKKFQLYNDPYGNYLITDISNESVLTQIAIDFSELEK